MNNFELNSRAQELAASHTSYNLARRLLALEEELQEARREFGQSQQTQGEAHSWVDPSESDQGRRWASSRKEGRFIEPLFRHPPAPAAVPEQWKAVIKNALSLSEHWKEHEIPSNWSPEFESVLNKIALLPEYQK